MYKTGELMKLLNVTRPTLLAMIKDGRIPEPLRMGETRRWPKEIIDKWLADGCPKREV